MRKNDCQVDAKDQRRYVKVALLWNGIL